MAAETAIRRIVLAYSGGLDTSVILRWLGERYGAEVIAFCADVGQGAELAGLSERARQTGATKAIVEDLREEFARDYVFPMLRAGAIYENQYLLGTSIARPLIARRQDAVRFVAAEIEALRFAMSHRDETIRVAHEITGAKPDDPRPTFVFDEAARTGVIGTELPLPLDKLEFMQKQLVSSGTLARPGDIERMIDRGVREEALALLARGR